MIGRMAVHGTGWREGSVIWMLRLHRSHVGRLALVLWCHWGHLLDLSVWVHLESDNGELSHLSLWPTILAVGLLLMGLR